MPPDTHWRAATPAALLIPVLALLNAVTPLSIDMYLSAFPQMATEFDTTPSAVQLTMTTFLVGLAAGQLVIGPLSDRYGRRRPLIIGAVACLLASALCIVAPSIGALIGLRFVQGFTGAAGVVISRAIIADVARGSSAARLFAVMMLISVAAPVIGPVLGGLIVSDLGWRAVFAALALINLLMVIGVLIGAPESLPVDQRRPSGFKVLAASTASVLRNRHYLGYTLTVALVAGAMFAYIAASPFVLQNIIGLGPRAYAFTFGACALAIAAGSMGSARIVGRFGPRRVLMGGVLAAVVIAALQLLNVTIGGVTPGVTIALMACFLAALGFVYANATSLAVTEVAYAAGTGSAVLGFLQYGAGAITPPLVGLAGSASAVPMGVVMATASVLAAAALFTLTRGHVVTDDRAESRPAVAEQHA
jgi:DHA1 family bicyclomycin/chloramphenicol resistance-like MFS transporter